MDILFRDISNPGKVIAIVRKHETVCTRLKLRIEKNHGNQNAIFMLCNREHLRSGPYHTKFRI
jgi:hypothetical protein